MIHIIQARDLPGLDLNPYVSIEIDDQKRYTSVLKSSNSPYFGEVNRSKPIRKSTWLISSVPFPLVFYLRFYSLSHSNDGESDPFQGKHTILSIIVVIFFFQIHHAKKIVSIFADTKPIGVFRLDVSTVYNEKEHIFEPKRAQLFNPDSIEAGCFRQLPPIVT